MQCITYEINQPWGSSLFWKCSKIDVDFTNPHQIGKISSVFQITVFELVALNTHFYRERIIVIGSQYLNKHSQDFICYSHGILETEFFSESSKNMTKLLPCKFEQCFEHFNMLTLHKCSDTWLFTHLSNQAFCNL